MKAHLALGIYGPRPRPLVGWQALQSQAQAVAANPSEYLPGLALIDALGLHGMSYTVAPDTSLENAQAAAWCRLWHCPRRARRCVVSQPLRLDRARTGFVRATQWHFDLDADGMPDLVAIEGVGRGPGHLDGPTKTDDAWYRLFFANIGGAWFVLGHDTFAYGCGC